MILLISTAQDSHANAIEAALLRRRVASFRLDVVDAHREVLVEIRPTSSGLSWSLEKRSDPKQRIDSATVTAVCLRRYGDRGLNRKLSYPDSEHLDRSEVMGALRKLLASLPSELFPLGQPRLIEGAENKLRQLDVALAMGFQIPETCYSNDPEVLARFAEAQDMVVVKPLSQSQVSSEDELPVMNSMWCRCYPGVVVAEKIRGVEMTQLYLQKAVSKVADLRIMVLPERIFACEIDTSALPADEPDWRPLTMQLPHRMIELEEEFERQLREFMTHMNLATGSFDFALTPEGERVFFECNPGGQWLWIEHLTGAPIADAVAEALIQGKRG